MSLLLIMCRCRRVPLHVVDDWYLYTHVTSVDDF